MLPGSKLCAALERPEAAATLLADTALSLADTMLRHLRATDAMKNFSEFRQEASMLHALQHPCIVALIGISIHPLCFALELAPLSSLNTVLSENARGTAVRPGP